MRLTLVLLMAFIAGCASQPQTPNTAKPAATTAPTTTATPAATPQPQTAVAQATTTYRPPSGYKQKKLGANTVYCKKDTTLGSRFPTEFCFTEDELKEMERRGEDMRTNKQKVSGLCGGVTGACGNE